MNLGLPDPSGTVQSSSLRLFDHALILETARAAGCTVVLSEDLNDDQDYGGVRVENPFKSARR